MVRLRSDEFGAQIPSVYYLFSFHLPADCPATWLPGIPLALFWYACQADPFPTLAKLALSRRNVSIEFNQKIRLLGSKTLKILNNVSRTNKMLYQQTVPLVNYIHLILPFTFLAVPLSNSIE